ncbi:MAG TPA: hypothetical protein PKW90_30030, partial [Myxococcota bacterium]|nr:hypothetical protein [Myxococcota bacterium]
FQRTGDQTFADEASLDHGRIRNALLRAHQEVAQLEQTDQVKALARRIQEAVALNHDASEMLVGNAFDEAKHKRDGQGRFARKREAPERGHDLLTGEERRASEGALRASEVPVVETSEWLRGDVGMRGSLHARGFHNVLGRVRSYLKDIKRYSSDLTNLAGSKYSVRGHHQLLRDRHTHIADALERGLLAYSDYHHHRAKLEKLISDHRFAATVHHDAAEEITNNSSGDNCGTGAGGFKPGNTCGKGGATESLAHEEHEAAEGAFAASDEAVEANRAVMPQLYDVTKDPYVFRELEAAANYAAIFSVDAENKYQQLLQGDHTLEAVREAVSKLST